jgi:hypothetical protein
MSKYILVLITVLLAMFPYDAAAADLLSGDQRLACEAILCLSSPAQPSECDPSLDRYFGINKKNGPILSRHARIF